MSLRDVAARLVITTGKKGAEGAGLVDQLVRRPCARAVKAHGPWVPA